MVQQVAIEIGERGLREGLQGLSQMSICDICGAVGVMSHSVMLFTASPLSYKPSHNAVKFIACRLTFMRGVGWDLVPKLEKHSEIRKKKGGERERGMKEGISVRERDWVVEQGRFFKHR